jgi:hypothetical protein
VDHLSAAISDQQEAINMMRLPITSKEEPEGGAKTLVRENALSLAIQRNLTLTRELVYAGNEHARPVSLLVRDITQSLQEARTATSFMPSSFAEHPLPSSELSTTR